MVVKNIKDIKQGILGVSKVLIKAVEKKSSLDLVKPMSSGRADDAMQGSVIEYAEIINSNGIDRFEDGDIVILANYSAPDTFAMHEGSENGDLYIIMSEHSIYYAVKPDNYNKK
jgi:hypothetical protein